MSFQFVQRVALSVLAAAAATSLCTACGGDSGDAAQSSAPTSPASQSPTTASSSPTVDGSHSGQGSSAEGFCDAAKPLADDLVNGLAVANVDNYRTLDPLAPPAIKPSLDYLVGALADAQNGGKPDTAKIDAEGKKVAEYYTANCS